MRTVETGVDGVPPVLFASAEAYRLAAVDPRALADAHAARVLELLAARRRANAAARAARARANGLRSRRGPALPVRQP